MYDCRDDKQRLLDLQRMFKDALKHFAASYYAPLRSAGIVSQQEINDELELFYQKKRSGLQTVYSYFAEQWDAYYQLIEADDSRFRSMLLCFEKAFSMRYDALEFDVRYYTERLNQLPFAGTEWLRLRHFFERKWYDLLSRKEQKYQEDHIRTLLDEYGRQLRSIGNETLNTGKPGARQAARLAWLQARQDPEVRKKLHDLLPLIEKNPMIAEICQALGRKDTTYDRSVRASHYGRSSATVRQNARSDIVGVCTGRDLNRLMPLEYCLLADSDLENVFLKKYSENALQMFDATSREKMYFMNTDQSGCDAILPDEMGPFIVGIDTSGSMAGQNELLAKSIVLAIALLAEQQHRACRVILFSDQSEQIEFRSLSLGLPLLKDFLCRSFQGGTDLLPAMQSALKGLSSASFARADLLLLSDFEMERPDALIARQFAALHERGASAYAVFFGENYTSEYLDFFEKYWKVPSDFA